MDINDAIVILTHFNKWRRGDQEHINYSPTEIGVAIDVLIKKHLDYTTNDKFIENEN